MKMAKSQLAAIQRLTNRIERSYHDGVFEYMLSDLENGYFLLSASNANSLRWFESSDFQMYSIGPKGGIKQRKVN